MVEAYHAAVHWLTEARDLYLHGVLRLEQRARAEQLYFAICRKLRPLLNPSVRAHRDLLDELNDKLAEKLFLNFRCFSRCRMCGHWIRFSDPAAAKGWIGHQQPSDATGSDLRFRRLHRALCGWRGVGEYFAFAAVPDGRTVPAGDFPAGGLSGDSRRHAQPVR